MHRRSIYNTAQSGGSRAYAPKLLSDSPRPPSPPSLFPPSIYITRVGQYQPACRQRKRVRRNERKPLLHDTPAVAVMQAVKPAKDLKTFLGTSLRQNGPFPYAPPSGDLDSGWEVTRDCTLLCANARRLGD